MNPCPKNKPFRLKGQKLADLYLDVFTRDGYKCQNPYCEGDSLIDKAPHHIKYKSQGGSDEEWNLVTLCMACHDKIHNRGTLKCEHMVGIERQILFINKTNTQP